MQLQIKRPTLALEAIQAAPRLVLLGEPGSGKSTVLRYLALLLALRLRGENIAIPGWPVTDTPVPLLVPLGRVATALAARPDAPEQAFWQLLGHLLAHLS